MSESSELSQSQIQKRVKYLRKRPDVFIEKVIGDTLEDYQKEVCHSFVKHDRLAIPACHAVGKTFLMGRITLAFLSCYKNSIVITTAPTHRQVVALLWGEIRKAHKRSETALGGKLLTNSLTIDDDWYAMGFSPQKGAGTDSTEQQGSSFQGFHARYVLIIFDEATGVPRDVYTMAEGLMTSGVIVKWVCIANPTTRASEFFKITKQADWAVHGINCFDSPNMKANGFTNVARVELELSRLRKLSDQDRLARIKAYKKPNGHLLSAQWAIAKIYQWGFGHPLTKSKILGEFPDTEDNTIIKWQNIQKAFDREDEPAPGDVRRIGLDVARFGEDSTVFTEMLGKVVTRIEADIKKSNTEVAGQAIAFILDSDKGAETHVVVDATGVGSGVVDILKDARRDGDLPDNVFIHEVHFAQAVMHPNPDKEKELRKTYHNLKSYIFDKLNEDIRDELTLPREEVYEEELPALLFTYSKQGKLLVEGKDDFKARYGKSPDYADSLALCNASKYLSKTHGSFTALAEKKVPKPFSKRDRNRRKRSGIKVTEY